mgnify:CR=1 FL=1
MRKGTEWIEKRLTPRNARLALVLLTLVSGIFAVALKDVRLDHDFENFFPTDDPELDRYNAFRERFGNDNDLLMIAVERKPTVFDREFLVKVDSLTLQLGRLPDVMQVVSPTRLEEVRITPVGAFKIPWVRTESDTLLALDSARVWRNERMRTGFFATDASAVLVLMVTEPGLSKDRSDSLLLRTEAVVARSGLTDTYMAGRIHGQYYYIIKMLRELVIFFSTSVVLLAIFLFFTFRIAWGVLVPITVVGLTVLWQVGLMTLLDEPLTVLTMLLPTILFVVGMSDVVHILERYIEALRSGYTRTRALAITYREVGLATLLTSLTTAVGFFTLTTSGIGPIRSFGMYTAIGVGLALILAFTLLPSILLLVPTPLRASKQRTRWYHALHRLFGLVLRHRRWIPWGFVVLVAIGIVGISRLKVNNFLLEDWPEDDPELAEFHYLEKAFGGVRPFEMEIDVKDSTTNVWDLRILRQVEELEHHLENGYGVHGILSPAVLVREVNKAFHGGAVEFDRLPEEQDEVDRLVKRVSNLPLRSGLATLVADDARTARITGRMVDEGGHVHAGKNRLLDSTIATITNDDLVDFHQTGMGFLIDRNNQRLSAQMIGGLSVAFLLISLIMAAVFRNWRMTIIALLPNVIPLVLIGGFMGFYGIDIKVSTAIIFTIAFGIAVDDTIHLLGKLRIELDKGRSLPYAMKRSFLSAGKAVIITSIMLCSGFISLIFSDLASVYYMGLLVSLTLAMAVITDLLLLPILVLRWLPHRK